MKLKHLNHLYNHLDYLKGKEFNYNNLNQHFSFFSRYHKEFIDGYLVFSKDDCFVQLLVIDYDNYFKIEEWEVIL